MLQPNLDPENSNVSFKTKVLFTYRQVTKSSCINLTGFGLRQNVQVLRTTHSLLWYQRTAVLLTYYHVINVSYKLLTSRRLHCYSRRSQWNSIPRGLTTIIWSLESLWRRKEQTRWEETVYTVYVEVQVKTTFILVKKTFDRDKLSTEPKPRTKLTFVD